MGALMMAIRQSPTQVDAVPVGDRIWKVTIANSFNVTHESSTLHFFLPRDTPFVKVVRQTLTHSRISIKRPERQTVNSNIIQAVADDPGEHLLLAEFIVHASDYGRWSPKSPRNQVLTTQQRLVFLNDANAMRLKDPLLTDALSTIRMALPTFLR